MLVPLILLSPNPATTVDDRQVEAKNRWQTKVSLVDDRRDLFWHP